MCRYGAQAQARLVGSWPILVVVVACSVSQALFADDPRAIFQASAPAVFLVESSSEGSEGPQRRGTAFLVADGLLATNAHVVLGGSRTSIRLAGSRARVVVAARDEANDLALIALKDEIDVSPLTLADGPGPTPGTRVYVISNPRGLERSISEGLLAATRAVDGRKLLQITAPVSPGSSGGPVFDGSGQVVGVVVAQREDGQNLNFAIPVEYLRALLDGAPRAPASAPEGDRMGRAGDRDDVERSGALSSVARQASGGNAAAQLALGRAYYRGEGTPRNVRDAVVWIRRSAEQGYAPAERTLGLMYSQGTGVQRDDVAGVGWLRKAAEQGDTLAQRSLGRAYGLGRGVPGNKSEALRWYRKAAEQGDGPAQTELGLALYNGDGVARDVPLAVRWWRLAAERGNARSQFHLALAYHDGEGVTKDLAQSAKWYGLAAEQGDADAQLGLGLAYWNGLGVAKDSAKAVEWWQKAAEQGQRKAQFHMGLACELGEGRPADWGCAVEWYAKAAQQGDAVAQLNLGFAYDKGTGVAQDRVAAAEWYRRSAEQGNAKAQHNLGTAYYAGRGVGKDLGQAVSWWKKAAEQGLPDSQFSLGFAYSQGDGVPQDYRTAAAWYRKAAVQGVPLAQFALGAAYDAGEGVQADGVLAYAWAHLAVKHGVDYARQLTSKVTLPAADLARAQQLSAGWREGQDLATVGAASAPESRPRTVTNSHLDGDISAAEIERFREIVRLTMSDASEPSASAREELWGILARSGLTDSSQVKALREHLVGVVVDYQKLFWEDALTTLASGRVYESPSRLAYEARLLRRGLLQPEDVRRNREHLQSIAMGKPMVKRDGSVILGNSEVVTPQMAREVLANLGATAARIDRLFTAPTPGESTRKPRPTTPTVY